MQTDKLVPRQYQDLLLRVLVGILGISAILAWWSFGPIPQSPFYHLFADQRRLFGIPNAGDVLSNLPFCLVGLAGIYTVVTRRGQLGLLTGFYLAFFIGIFITGLGSSYYHLEPANWSLFWDRLPMSIAFMSILAAIIAERIDSRLGQKLFPWLVTAGIASVFYWHLQDDLRPYLLVQFGTLTALPLIVVLYRRNDSALIWLALAFYILAKLFEACDAQIFAFTSGWISGHTLKHLFASLTPLMILLKLQPRFTRAELQPRETRGQTTLRNHSIIDTPSIAACSVPGRSERQHSRDGTKSSPSE